MPSQKIITSKSLESENVILFGKRDFADVIKEFEMGRLSTIIQLSSTCMGGTGDVIHRIGGGNVTMEAETRGCSQKPRNAGSQKKDRNGKELLFS